MIADINLYLLFLECHRRFRYEGGNLIYRIKPANRIKAGEVSGCLNGDGYLQVKIKTKAYAVHRLIFLMHHGCLPGEVDHIDTNKLNNHIENLRPATHAENKHNEGIRKNNTSGVKGVSWNKDAKKWHARCCVNGKEYYIGSFGALSEAEQMIRSFRRQHHGSFANHGDPSKTPQSMRTPS